MHFEDFESHECAVNSSEFAGHGRALQRPKHQLPFPYRKNPLCVRTVWGKRSKTKQKRLSPLPRSTSPRKPTFHLPRPTLCAVRLSASPASPPSGRLQFRLVGPLHGAKGPVHGDQTEIKEHPGLRVVHRDAEQAKDQGASTQDETKKGDTRRSGAQKERSRRPTRPTTMTRAKAGDLLLGRGRMG